MVAEDHRNVLARRKKERKRKRDARRLMPAGHSHAGVKGVKRENPTYPPFSLFPLSISWPRFGAEMNIL